jgi:cellulose synthase/poly-beta-1,6-N-acetylglucosamine synthase-like glycosyltransferase
MIPILFWVLIFLILYCYIGYPFILSIFSRVFFRPVQKAAMTPSISIVVSLWNEEDVIEEKIKNLLSLDYPQDCCEILIGSDGSTDQTNQIVRKYANDRVRLLESSERQGKTKMINALIKEARGEIIVFTDARQMFDTDALKILVANFADPKIGCVSGELIFVAKDVNGATAQGINLYWNYEKFIRRCESKIHSMLGATGAIYAIRKELYESVPENTVLDDMYTPFRIIQKGYRAIFDDAAKAYDKIADNPQEEYRRKARTLYGNYQIFFLLPGMFNPARSPIAVQLFSHKFLRVVIPIFMIIIFILNFVLLDESFYRIIFGLQILFYSLAIVGMITRKSQQPALKIIAKISYVPYIFCLLNFSALVGLTRFLSAKQSVKWEKARSL